MPRLMQNSLNESFNRITHALTHSGVARHVFTISLALILVGIIALGLMLGANEGASQYAN